MGRRQDLTGPGHQAKQVCTKNSWVCVCCTKGLEAIWQKCLGIAEGPQEGDYQLQDLLGPPKPGEADSESFCNRRYELEEAA